MSSYQKPGRKVYKTMRGVALDVEKIKDNNQGTVALTGNGSSIRRNGRGDVLGKNGQVLKTEEQLQADYEKMKDTSGNGIKSIRKIGADSFESPQDVLKKLEAEKENGGQKTQHQLTPDTPSNVIGKAKGRKLVEKDDE